MSKRHHPIDPSHATSEATRLYTSLGLLPRPPRSRRWERQHQDRKVSYRGVDPKLTARVKSLASQRGLPEGRVAGRLIDQIQVALFIGSQGLVDHPSGR